MRGEVMVTIALNVRFVGVKMSDLMALQTVKSGMSVIIRHVLIKHFMRSTAITAVNLM
jgi:hypothetical protein